MKPITTKHRILLVLLSVLLLSAGWLGVSGIGLLVALVPLLIISESYGDSLRDLLRMCGWGTLTFMLWSAATIWWVWIATPLGPITAGVVGTFWNMVALMAYHYVSKRAPRALAYTLFVAIWITTESAYNSAEVMTFPWLLLGHGFSNDIWAVQWYEYTGLFGGTLWALVSNVAIFEVLRTRTRRAKVRAALVALVPMILSIGIYMTYDNSASRYARVAVVQPNAACYSDSFVESDAVASLVKSVDEGVQFVVMPESSLCYIDSFVYSNGHPESLDEANLSRYAHSLKMLFGQRDSMMMITGASTRRHYGQKPQTTTAHYAESFGYYDNYNSALLVDSDGVIEDVYHKGKLVIGVEATPMPELLEAVDLGGISGQLGWGEGHKVFANDGVVVGPAICYEGLYGDYFAGFVRKGANLMAVISNDGWWGNTPGHKRLFDFCRLRAIECRRAIARSANTGISGFIAPDGRTIGGRLEWDERGVLTADLPLCDEVTFYVRYGDLIARVSLFVSALGAMYFVAYRARRRNHLVD